MSDIQARVNSDLAERLNGSKGSFDDICSEIERLEHDFDFDSHYPYSNQELDVIRDLEDEYWRDAVELSDSGQTFKPSEWEQARRVYASCLAYCAYSSFWEQAKQELIAAIEDFDSEAQNMGCEEPIISLSLSCTHGWAAHNRETSEGVLIWESRQLDGANGLAREIGDVWMSVCFEPTKN